MRTIGRSTLRGCLLLLFLILPCLAFAQRNVDVSGTVRDEMGRPVANAHLSAQRVKTNKPVETVSGADGIYSMSNLPTGDYTIVIRASGFATRRIVFTLTGSSDKANLDVTLAHEAEAQEAPRQGGQSSAGPPTGATGFRRGTLRRR